MRNLIKTLIAVLFTTAISACVLEEKPDPTSTWDEISITAETVQEQAETNIPETKTTLSGLETHWIANEDTIGIFSPQARTTDGGETPVQNAEFTAQSSAKSSAFTGDMYWGDNVAHHFYAYYPYNPAHEGDETVVPISLSSGQNQSEAGNTDHIGVLDYMVATPDTIARGGAVNLTFNHVFSMIEFRITGSGNLTQVSLSGADPLAFSSGTIDLTRKPSEGTPYDIATSSTLKYVTVTLGSAAKLSAITAKSIYLMVLPGTQSQDLLIALKIDGVWKEMSKAQPPGGFARGKKYIVELNTESGWSTNLLTDSRDDKTYSYKTIGSRVWMTENLAYLPSVVGLGTGSDTTPYYYVYGYDGTDVAAAKATENYQTYGVLYNWTAAFNACPAGWHLPNDTEWAQLTTYLGGENVAGGKMKEAGTTHWNSPNTAANNDSGFSGLPGGILSCINLYDEISYNFVLLGWNAFWWSSTEYSSDSAWAWFLEHDTGAINKYSFNKGSGYSVRCVKTW
jgi:uncharacterized protein (TIGR02145 family)